MYLIVTGTLVSSVTVFVAGFLPTLITCSTGSFVMFSSDLSSPSALPFLIAWVYLVVFEPGCPLVTTSLLPASRVLSSIILTVNGISSFTS